MKKPGMPWMAEHPTDHSVLDALIEIFSVVALFVLCVLFFTGLDWLLRP